MAGDPLCLPLLLGLDIDELSMNAVAIPLVKQTIRAMSLEEAKADFQKAISLNTAREVREYIFERMRRKVPELEEKEYRYQNA
jgi:phosphotransferase system enzyme I (PtsI)